MDAPLRERILGPLDGSRRLLGMTGGAVLGAPANVSDDDAARLPSQESIEILEAAMIRRSRWREHRSGHQRMFDPKMTTACRLSGEAEALKAPLVFRHGTVRRHYFDSSWRPAGFAETGRRRLRGRGAKGKECHCASSSDFRGQSPFSPEAAPLR